MCVLLYRMSKCYLVSDEGGLYMEREARVLTGLVDHVLPRVGSHVHTFDLAHGKAVSNAIVRYMYIYIYMCIYVPHVH